MFSYLKLFDFQPDLEEEHRSHFSLKSSSDAHSQDSFPNFFHCLHFEAHLGPTGKSFTMGLSKLGVQMAEAMFYGFKVVKKMVEV